MTVWLEIIAFRPLSLAGTTPWLWTRLFAALSFNYASSFTHTASTHSLSLSLSLSLLPSLLLLFFRTWPRSSLLLFFLTLSSSLNVAPRRRRLRKLDRSSRYSGSEWSLISPLHPPCTNEKRTTIMNNVFPFLGEIMQTTESWVKIENWNSYVFHTLLGY